MSINKHVDDHNITGISQVSDISGTLVVPLVVFVVIDITKECQYKEANYSCNFAILISKIVNDQLSCNRKKLPAATRFRVNNEN